MESPQLAEDILWKVHSGFFTHHFNLLPTPYASQDANRVTLSYFVIGALDLLDSMTKINKSEVIDWIYAQQVVPDKEDPSTFFFSDCCVLHRKTSFDLRH